MMKEEAMLDGVITEAETCREFVTSGLMAEIMRLPGEIEALVTKVRA